MITNIKNWIKNKSPRTFGVIFIIISPIYIPVSIVGFLIEDGIFKDIYNVFKDCFTLIKTGKLPECDA